MTPALKPHQVTGIEWLRTHDRAILADEPGLGKTRMALEAASGRTLIITPAMLDGVWNQHEIPMWTPGLDYLWTPYTRLSGRETVERNGRKVSVVTGRPRPELRQKWDTLILDEAHYLCGRKANWTKLLFGTTLRAPRIWLITGTPMRNWGHELYSICRILHEPGDKRYSSYWRWVNQYFQVYLNPWGGQEIGELHEGMTWEVFAEWNDLPEVMLARTLEDAGVELPPLTETYIECGMGVDQMKAYASMKRDFFVEIEGHQIVALHAGSKANQLRKISTSLGVADPELASKPSGKLEALKELLDSLKGRSSIVLFCHYRRSADLVADVCAQAGLRTGKVMGGVPQRVRDDTVNAFQAGKIDALVGTLGTIQEGITLTRARYAIFVERSFRPTTNQQAIKRLHRIGQTSPVTAYHLVTAKTVDKGMLKVLEEKTEQQIAAMTPLMWKRIAEGLEID